MAKEKLRKESYNKDRPEEEAGFRILCRYVMKYINNVNIHSNILI